MEKGICSYIIIVQVMLTPVGCLVFFIAQLTWVLLSNFIPNAFTTINTTYRTLYWITWSYGINKLLYQTAMFIYFSYYSLAENIEIK